MNKQIAVLPGDGIGPEVIAEAQKSLQAIEKIRGHKFTYVPVLGGAAAIDACGNPMPDETVEVCKQSDAVLFGAFGSPKYDNDPNAKVRPEQGLLAIRKRLELFANIRPIYTFPALIHKSPIKKEIVDGADFVVVRELTGGMYFGMKGRTEDGKSAFDTNLYSVFEIERILKCAYELSLKRRKKLLVVDKANVLASSRLWRETAQRISKDYPEVETSYMFVDNASMRIVTTPKDFDVMVTENTFGDILTDEASVITGSMGLMPSASIGVYTSLFEPIHGSYPQAAGKNIANPMAAILSAAMLLETGFGLKEEAQIVTDAVNKALADGIRTEDIAEGKAYGTKEVGDYIAKAILETK
ncbi:MAG: 3-isopropylmalate dehydrogenase [Bacteroidales bacterium]|nr:3-isopropylmalate dehydrogenase [Bacteroidales bacterium]MBR4677078.1 3-isopropylmalate dehydrogenase [Bacteroidales bacterium]MCR4559191.1 3-isopropylmalate dehydrogenase [Bacteroidales bacterium]